ncbi:proline/glycine betaine ABC transporter ATP-binding protein ProV [Fulvimarina endophytica]|uniref:Quaternary amine transport ATP-binding protein n=2 Tax=Fulvimarina endophytica TaxID=2293836 RepID=A0A371X5U5_9HYPH|nr:glycine betaine/L-proline ABC transporter ATP-binding protein ProV [Fulvimarina endophytica]RFC64573.1 proline/glycine betaine ABC transporter ATP-binding protein ProV [Fulvimarina endophytica]
MTDALQVRNLFKVFGDKPQEAIDLYRRGDDKDDIFAKTGMMLGVCDASFTVREGEIFVVMGLSGSGKSTLVRMLNRLIDPSAGEIIVAGQDIATLKEDELLSFRRQHISMVFQSFALMPHMTVLQNAAFGLELSGVPQKQREERALDALKQVGLGAYGRNYPNQLSGGMQQRVGLARALANDPTILLMDEAFSALDPLIRTEMQDELLTLQAEQRRTIVFISHDLDEAMRIGDRIAIMQGGRVVQVGTPEDILNRPANDYVKSFFRGVNVQNVISVKDIARTDDIAVLQSSQAATEALREMGHAGFGFVTGPDGRFEGAVSRASLEARGSGGDLSGAFLQNVDPVGGDATLTDLIRPAARHECPVPIVDARGLFIGAVSRKTLLESMQRDGATHG